MNEKDRKIWHIIDMMTLLGMIADNVVSRKNVKYLIDTYTLSSIDNVERLLTKQLKEFLSQKSSNKIGETKLEKLKKIAQNNTKLGVVGPSKVSNTGFQGVTGALYVAEPERANRYNTQLKKKKIGS